MQASDRNRRCPRPRRLFAAAGLVVAMAVIGTCGPALTAWRFSLCPWWTLTGHACPFCGLTRALASALRGDVSAAGAWHPLWPVAGIAVVALGAALSRDGISGSDHWGRLHGRLRARFPVLLAALAVGAFVRW